MGGAPGGGKGGGGCRLATAQDGTLCTLSSTAAAVCLGGHGEWRESVVPGLQMTRACPAARAALPCRPRADAADAITQAPLRLTGRTYTPAGFRAPVFSLPSLYARRRSQKYQQCVWLDFPANGMRGSLAFENGYNPGNIVMHPPALLRALKKLVDGAAHFRNMMYEPSVVFIARTASLSRTSGLSLQIS